MNSLEYFAKYNGESMPGLRGDKFETKHSVQRAGQTNVGYSTISAIIGDNKEEFDLGPEAIVWANLPLPKSTMLFCMGSISISPDGTVPGCIDGKFIFDKRYKEFGSHIIFIKSPKEFLKRVISAYSDSNEVFSSKYAQSGFGLVNYIPLEKYSGAIGFFTKDVEYEWQHEYRFVLCANESSLNNSGALEFHIGDITDISSIYPIQTMLDNPISIQMKDLRKPNKNINDQ